MHSYTSLIPAAFLLLSLHGTLFSQVNTEKLRRTDSTRGVFFSLGASAGLVRGNSEYFSLGGSLRNDLVGESSYHFIVGEYELKESGAGKISNKGFLHARTMWDVNELLAWEGFAQAQFNEFISLKNRGLVGTGMRLGIAALRGSDGQEVLRSFLGVGLMYEHERYATEPAEIEFSRLRSTNYLTVYLQLEHRVSLTGVFYAQPLMTDIGDHRFVAEASLGVGITSSISLLVDLAWNYNNRPVSSVKRYDLELTNGLMFTFR